MGDTLQMLAMVALLDDLPERDLKRGQAGTIVEILAADVYEVEFSDDQGKAYAILPLRAGQLLPLYFHSSA